MNRTKFPGVMLVSFLSVSIVKWISLVDKNLPFYKLRNQYTFLVFLSDSVTVN